MSHKIQLAERKSLKSNTRNARQLKGGLWEKSLISAADNGRLNYIKYFVTFGADVKANNYEALKVAAKKGHLDIVRYLIKKSNPNNVSTIIPEALRLAAIHGHFDVLKCLAEIDVKDAKNVKSMRINANNSEALRVSAYYGHFEIVKYLVENGANVDANDNEALINAAQAGHFNIVQYLVQHGAKINANDNEALINAAQAGHLNIVEYLTLKGLNINAIDNRALNYALVAVIDVYKKNDGKTGKVYIPIIRYLINNGANVNIKNGYALRTITKYGDVSDVQYLISKGANIHVNNDEALSNAISAGNIDLIKYLVTQGAILNTDKYNVRTLQNVAKEGDDKLIQYLIHNRDSASTNDANNIKCSAEGTFACVVYGEDLVSLTNSLKKLASSGSLRIELSGINNALKPISLETLLGVIDMNTAIRIFQPLDMIDTYNKTRTSIRLLQKAAVDINAETSIKTINNTFYFGKITLEKGHFIINEQNTKSILFMFLTKCQSNVTVFRRSKASIDRFHTLFKTLQKLHKKNIVHLDLKPQNLLYCNHDIKMSDFDTLLDIDNTVELPLDPRYYGTIGYTPSSKEVLLYVETFKELTLEIQELILYSREYYNNYISLKNAFVNPNLLIQRILNSKEQLSVANAFQIWTLTEHMKTKGYSSERALLSYILKQADEFALGITLLECSVLNNKCNRFIMDLLDWRKQAIENFNAYQYLGETI